MHPLEALRAIGQHLRCDPPFNRPDYPLGAGLMGYLAYDLKDVLEELPRTSMDRWRLPHLCFYAPALVLVYDKRNRQTHPVTGKNSLPVHLTAQRLNRNRPSSRLRPFWPWVTSPAACWVWRGRQSRPIFLALPVY